MTQRMNSGWHEALGVRGEALRTYEARYEGMKGDLGATYEDIKE